MSPVRGAAELLPRRAWRRLAATPLNRSIVLVCVALIAGIWTVTLQRVAFEREQAVAATMQSNANLAIAFEQQVFRTLKAAEQVAAFVREQYLEKGAAIDLPGWVEQGVIRETPFNIVSVVDEHGDIVGSSRSVPRVNYADRPFFEAQRIAAEDTLYINQPVLGRVSGRWQIPMSLRITHRDGGFGGVVVMSVDPETFTEFYRQTDLGSRGLLELTGLDGVVRGRKIGGQSSFGLDARSTAWFESRADLPEGALVDDGAALDGVLRVVSYRSMQGYPLMVTVGSAYQDALEPVLQRQVNYAAVAAGASAALLLFAALLMLALSRQRTAAEALQASEALFRATFHQAAMGIAHIAPDGRILRANDKFCRMLGYRLEELRGHSVFELSDAEGRDEMRQFLSHRLSAEAELFSPEIEKRYRRKDGSELWVCEALGVVAGAQGRPDFLVAVTQDITTRKELEARLSHDALHDALTGLPNRVMFMDRLARVLESARRRRESAAVLYIDLDGFKTVNDSYGHAAGDELLQQVARRLEASVRAEDTVARFGGDEFGVVLATLSRIEDCELVASKVLHALAQPFGLAAATVRISASIGAAVFPAQGEDAETLLARADAAMYVAKGAGKNRFEWERPSACGLSGPDSDGGD